MTWSVSSSCSELSNRLLFANVHEKMYSKKNDHSIIFQANKWWEKHRIDWRKWTLTTWPPPPPPASIDRIWNYPGAHYPVHTHWATEQGLSEEMVTGADSLASISQRLGEARGNNRWQSQSTDAELTSGHFWSIPCFLVIQNQWWSIDDSNKYWSFQRVEKRKNINDFEILCQFY